MATNIINLSSLDGTNGFRMDGAAAGDFFGGSVSNAGDINGDGFDDAVVGGNLLADPNGISNAGSSYVVFGRSDFGGGGLPEIAGTPNDNILKGTLAAEHFKAGDGNDMMIGRGGAGHGVLHLDDKDLNLDLTNYLDHIQSIESICLYGRGDNTLSLTGAELKELSDTTDTLKLHGNAGDQVILEGEWVNG